MFKYFKDAEGTPFALALDGSTDYLIHKHGLVRMNAEEESELLDPPKTLQELASAAMVKVNEQYNQRMGAIANAYPLHERESWPVQLSEARDLQSNPNTATPWIDQCALQRGITREVLAARIVDKDSAYRQISGFLTGVRQKHEDEIDALLEAGEASRPVLQAYYWAEYWEPESASFDGSEVLHD